MILLHYLFSALTDLHMKKLFFKKKRLQENCRLTGSVHVFKAGLAEVFMKIE